MTQHGKAIGSLSVIPVLLVLGMTAGGCSNATEGAVSGAGIGALSGLAIGSITGDAGAGAAIGAIAGGVGGAVIGDQNRRRDEAQAAAGANPPPPRTQTVTVYSASTTYVTGEPLGRLVGNWRVSGTIDNGAGGGMLINGTATGTVEKTFFVRLDLRLTDPRNNQPIEGTSVINQTGGRGIEMTNSFNTSPDVARFRGEMDASGSVFTLTETAPKPGERKLILRIGQGREWTAEVWRGQTKGESLRFTPSESARQ